MKFLQILVVSEERSILFWVPKSIQLSILMLEDIGGS